MDSRAIIIDHGSGILKAGFSGYNEPQTVFPNIVNYIPCQENPGPSYARRRVSLGIDFGHPDTYSYPIERGRVLNWEGVEYMWSLVFEKHRQEYEDFPVVITENPLREPADRKKTLEIMFELLKVPSILMVDQLEMSLYASGLLTGVVIDSGYGLTRVKSFHMGRPLPSSCKTVEFAGQDLATYLFNSLFKEDCNKHNLFQLETVTMTQISKCYVPQNLAEALDFCQSLPSGFDENNTYQLPDGTPVELTAMQRLAPEMFFSPQVFDLPGPSISQVFVESLEACDTSMRPQLMSHVVACGGNTLYPGFPTRLYQELTNTPFSSTNPAIWASSNRNFSVWIGASVLSHLSTYKSEWITREEYDESMRL